MRPNPNKVFIIKILVGCHFGKAVPTAKAGAPLPRHASGWSLGRL